MENKLLNSVQRKNIIALHQMRVKGYILEVEMASSKSLACYYQGEAIGILSVLHSFNMISSEKYSELNLKLHDTLFIKLEEFKKNAR